MNDTDYRILKLRKQGLSPQQIARKIGRPGAILRVKDTLARAKKG